jgi:hypothetical protein
MRTARRQSQDHQIIGNTPIQNKPLADAILGSGYTPP